MWGMEDLPDVGIIMGSGCSHSFIVPASIIFTDRLLRPFHVHRSHFLDSDWLVGTTLKEQMAGS